MFESLVESYKKMSDVDKKNSLMDEIKKTIAILESICDEKGITYREVKNKEILDYKDGKETISNYLETLFVYVMYLQELLGSYVEKTLK